MKYSNNYKDFNYQGIRDENNCCLVSWSTVFNASYQKTYEFFRVTGKRKLYRGMTEPQIEKLFSEVKHTKIKKGPYTKTNRVTLKRFCELHPEGRYFVLVRKHALAVIDGYVTDHMEKPRRQVTAAWRVHLD